MAANRPTGLLDGVWGYGCDVTGLGILPRELGTVHRAEQRARHNQHRSHRHRELRTHEQSDQRDHPARAFVRSLFPALNPLPNGFFESRRQRRRRAVLAKQLSYAGVFGIEIGLAHFTLGHYRLFFMRPRHSTGFDKIDNRASRTAGGRPPSLASSRKPACDYLITATLVVGTATAWRGRVRARASGFNFSDAGTATLRNEAEAALNFGVPTAGIEAAMAVMMPG